MKTYDIRWKGFNLLDLFTEKSRGEFKEEYFKWISDWGFNFIRVPMNYRLWIENGDIYKFKEEIFRKIDKVIELGDKYNLHISLNFHRAPGYCINGWESEPFILWKDAEAEKAFVYHWKYFADRYSGISSDKLSFDLVNEPPNLTSGRMTIKDYERVIRSAVSAIREIDGERLIIAEGVDVGNTPCPGLVDLGVMQSCRAYMPFGISHYKASWIDADFKEKPVWPGGMHFDGRYDKDRLEEHYKKWAELSKKGIRVHCGEGGCYNKTPHDVFLSWFKDVLSILKKYDIGFSLWEFSGNFGIMDSGRDDVCYENWYGHKLDRKLLELLQNY